MAGSYKHVVTKSGKLNTPERVCGMLDCSSGDVYEVIEGVYGMIWYLADGDPTAVEEARQEYRTGLEISPGLKDA